MLLFLLLNAIVWESSLLDFCMKSVHGKIFYSLGNPTI